jgi:hypothetical protein
MHNSAYLSLFLTATLGLTACNSGSSQAASNQVTSSNTNTSLAQPSLGTHAVRNTQASAATALAPGNGIINYTHLYITTDKT